MRSVRTWSLHLALILLALASFAPRVDATGCVSGPVTASVSNDPGFVGLYKYCVNVEWTLGQNELGHLDVFLELDNCECVCDSRLIKFGVPAGWQTGEYQNGESCLLNYFGKYACAGDPSIPDEMNGPAVKFEPDALLACPPSIEGSGSFCFYSPMPPSPPGVFANGLAIKHGREICYGTLEGVLPTCNCALPTHRSTIGVIKATYR
jgi:hypothetical protein